MTKNEVMTERRKAKYARKLERRAGRAKVYQDKIDILAKIEELNKTIAVREQQLATLENRLGAANSMDENSPTRRSLIEEIKAEIEVALLPQDADQKALQELNKKKSDLEKLELSLRPITQNPPKSNKKRMRLRARKHEKAKLEGRV